MIRRGLIPLLIPFSLILFWDVSLLTFPLGGFSYTYPYIPRTDTSPAEMISFLPLYSSTTRLKSLSIYRAKA